MYGVLEHYGGAKGTEMCSEVEGGALYDKRHTPVRRESGGTTLASTAKEVVVKFLVLALRGEHSTRLSYGGCLDATLAVLPPSHIC